MKFPNPQAKKVKKAQPMLVSCGVCKADLICYQKLGKGGLLRMYLERVVTSQMPLGDHDLICPECGNLLGVLIHAKGKDCYKMRRGYYQARFMK
ncbi:hypothetical protein AWM75_00830 [Aerococcus urinaehominis]|uniref:Uncharacterized protein n=1 Tax=Aerococcus urinaehominis TaxID=128944 RepID=A0A0X8FJT8_9LACT|nr:hypothetical protein [Aerococcus urinaehominis]AMB98626.1 hypothetical protein AWM75_00830 [Aerococcus urinaehominis]SDL95790.1 hypothetical protein SAMN04487985_10325 [Aerococcus urinaehominis]